MNDNVQIFFGVDYEPYSVIGSLVGYVLPSRGDYTSGQTGNDGVILGRTWKDEVIVEVFSQLVAKKPRFVSSENYFSILHNDCFGRPVASEEWRFNPRYTGQKLLRSVFLQGGRAFHCVEAAPFDEKQILLLLDRTV